MSKSSPRLTLSDFIDIVAKSGTPKATAISAIKHREDYAPEKDFYKIFRDHVVTTHRKGRPRAELKALLPTLRDEKKQANYPQALQGYSKWWGSRTFKWFNPPAGTIVRTGVELSVTPELGLLIGGTPYVIKLYLKGEPLAKSRADIINHVLEVALRPSAPAGSLMAVLDVRRARLQQPSGKTPVGVLDGLVDGELAYVASLWPKV